MVIILQSKIDAFINHRSEVSPKSFFFDYNKPKTKLIQNITQSHEIRFGDALKFLFEKYFEAKGFYPLSKKI